MAAAVVAAAAAATSGTADGPRSRWWSDVRRSEREIVQDGVRRCGEPLAEVEQVRLAARAARGGVKCAAVATADFYHAPGAPRRPAIVFGEARRDAFLQQPHLLLRAVAARQEQSVRRIQRRSVELRRLRFVLDGRDRHRRHNVGSVLLAVAGTDLAALPAAVGADQGLLPGGPQVLRPGLEPRQARDLGRGFHLGLGRFGDDVVVGKRMVLGGGIRGLGGGVGAHADVDVSGVRDAFEGRMDGVVLLGREGPGRRRRRVGRHGLMIGAVLEGAQLAQKVDPRQRGTRRFATGPVHRVPLRRLRFLLLVADERVIPGQRRGDRGDGGTARDPHHVVVPVPPRDVPPRCCGRRAHAARARRLPEFVVLDAHDEAPAVQQSPRLEDVRLERRRRRRLR
mmetsp:Transcript_1151/g.2727  ORF Transcript_1151/g.2727 Transcript_1151/m.2727 type:complete len:396 (+) Transcript_1151:1761-2948(+)